MNQNLLYSLLLVMTWLGAIASLCLKKAANRGNLCEIIKTPFLYAGGLLYASSATLNIILLKNLEYSVVLPMTSITYIWTLVLSHYFLNEKIGFRNMIGVLGIVIGAVMIVM